MGPQPLSLGAVHRRAASTTSGAKTQARGTLVAAVGWLRTPAVVLALFVEGAAATDGPDGVPTVPTANGGRRAAAGNADGGALRVEVARSKTQWADDDPIEVYYGEFLLAQWVLDRAPWNAYHSGLAFVNNRTGQKVFFDYSPVDTSSVMNMVIPEVRAASPWRAYLFGDADLVWRDEAKTQFFVHWPENYKTFVRLGGLRGRVFNRFVAWVVADFAPHSNAFQPMEVATPGHGTVVRSRMCHDFVTDALQVLHRHGVMLKPEDIIFRDHIILYADTTEDASELVRSPRGRRQWLRYLRGVALFLEDIRQAFTHARHALAVGWRLGLPVFLRAQGRVYRLRLVPPFVNYCYLPLTMPPQVHDPFGSAKLCALDMEANASNASVPWPSGPLLAAEERLDRAEVWLALLLVALAASAPLVLPLRVGPSPTAAATSR